MEPFDNGYTISTEVCQIKVQLIASELYISQDNFKASLNWVRWFFVDIISLLEGEQQ